MTNRRYPRHVWATHELSIAGEWKRHGLTYAQIPGAMKLSVTGKAVKRALQKNAWAQ